VTRWIIVGAGYTGARVAALVAARGDTVVVTRRTLAAAQAVAPAGATARALDLDPAANDPLADLFGPGDLVVITAAPTDAEARGDQRLAAAARAAGVARIVYVSSTGVYAAAGGEPVAEDFTLAPRSATGGPRLVAEAALRASGVPTVALRAAGIYGPERGIVARMRAGTYRAIGDGLTAASRIHVDDLAAAIVAAGVHRAPLPVYNVADDEPGPSRELVEAAMAAFSLPAPPTVAVAAVEPRVAAMVTADRRIDNTRLRQHLGLALRYPSWRAALAAGAM